MPKEEARRIKKARPEDGRQKTPGSPARAGVQLKVSGDRGKMGAMPSFLFFFRAGTRMAKKATPETATAGTS